MSVGFFKNLKKEDILLVVPFYAVLYSIAYIFEYERFSYLDLPLLYLEISNETLCYYFIPIFIMLLLIATLAFLFLSLVSKQFLRSCILLVPSLGFVVVSRYLSPVLEDPDLNKFGMLLMFSYFLFLVMIYFKPVYNINKSMSYTDRFYDTYKDKNKNNAFENKVVSAKFLEKFIFLFLVSIVCVYLVTFLGKNFSRLEKIYSVVEVKSSEYALVKKHEGDYIGKKVVEKNNRKCFLDGYKIISKEDLIKEEALFKDAVLRKCK